MSGAANRPAHRSGPIQSKQCSSACRTGTQMSPPSTCCLDERLFSKPFDGWLNAKQRTLEFRFKIPADYPGHRASIPAYVKSLLSDRDLLGITTLYIGSGPVKQCTDILKKARSRRPQWSEPVSLYNAQFFWMKRSPRSPSIYVKMVVDSDEICMLVVSENSPAYRNEFGSDVVCPRKPLPCCVLTPTSTNSSKSSPSLCV